MALLGTVVRGLIMVIEPIQYWLTAIKYNKKGFIGLAPGLSAKTQVHQKQINLTHPTGSSFCIRGFLPLSSKIKRWWNFWRKMHFFNFYSILSESLYFTFYCQLGIQSILNKKKKKKKFVIFIERSSKWNLSFEEENLGRAKRCKFSLFPKFASRIGYWRKKCVVTFFSILIFGRLKLSSA